MPLFLICFIVFVIVIRVKMKHTDSAATAAQEAFWEREAKANFARARDIHTLDYIVVPENTLPFCSTEDEKEEDLQRQVQKCIASKMLNLSQFSNTDLKEQYGAANLDELSECDQNFSSFSRALSNWGSYRYEQQDFAAAKRILEYAHSLQCDISTIYVTLGHIYAKENQLQKLDALIQEIEASDNPLKASISKQLQLCRLED